MNKRLLITGTIFGLLAIIIGAFAAHGLKPHLAGASMESFETGVKYQMYNALFLLFLGTLNSIPAKAKNICYYLTLFGVILFSGSIYILSTDELTSLDITGIAFITPFGGTLMIISWLWLLLQLLKLKNE